MSMDSAVQRLLLKGAIAEMTPEEQQKIRSCHEEINQLVAGSGDAGLLAVTLAALDAAEKMEN